jgi:hypothetical protein
MPILISPTSFTHIYFSDIFTGIFQDGSLSAVDASSDPVYCTPFALSVGELEARRFDCDVKFVEVTPSAAGLPTIRDYDILIYCASWLANAMFDEKEKNLSRNLQFAARDFFDFSKRGIGGAQYDSLAQSLERLAGSRLATNIPHPDGINECDNFNLIRYEAELDRDGRMETVNIELPEKLYRLATDWTLVCAMHPDYFSLTPLHRLTYILAKIQCGEWQPWVVSLNELHRLTGCSSPLRKFKNSVQGLLKDNSIPEYRLELDALKMMVTFYRLPEATPMFVPIPVSRSARA